MPSPRRTFKSRRTTRKAVFRPSSRIPFYQRLQRRPRYTTPVLRPGIPIMQDVFDDARLLIEIAFGQDITVSPLLWGWEDVTTDVQVAGGSYVEFSRGRSNEAGDAQPAQCTFRLDNAGGPYSQGVDAFWWPNIRRGTPVRVRVDPDGLGFRQRFTGFADSFQPRWDKSGASAWVEVTASGSLRRISQGSQPVVSAMTRTTLKRANVVAYWPAEEGKNANQLASAIGGTPMSFIGAPELASNTQFDCSNPIPVLKNTVLRGSVPRYSGTGQVQLRFLMACPSGGFASDFILASLFVSGGSVCRLDLVYKTGSGGSLQLKAYSGTGGLVMTGGLYGYAADGKYRQYSLTMAQNGANIDCTIIAQEIGTTFNLSTVDTITTRTVSQINSVSINPDRAVTDFALGQFIVLNTSAAITSELVSPNAYASEDPADRLGRVATENGLFYVVYDNTGVDDPAKMRMGPQKVQPLLTLLRECEANDGGIMFDGDTEGVSLRRLRSIENQDTAVLTADFAAGATSGEFEPLDDDQFNRNLVVATRQAGAAYTVTDSTGPLGTTKIGIYDDSITVSLDADQRAQDVAGWAVNLGTVEGYRYPVLELDFNRTPELASTWANSIPGDRVDLLNVRDVRPEHPAGDISTILVGSHERISQFEWLATANLAPYSPYRVGILANDTGDTGPEVLRCIVEGSTLASSATSGASSLSVATPTGPLWTTVADDFPFTISVQGIAITVTAISGTSSPQTFTVDPTTVTRNLSNSQPVELWFPAVLGR